MKPRYYYSHFFRCWILHPDSEHFWRYHDFPLWVVVRG